MPSHIMLSYQWDDQALVKKIYNRLRDDGLPVWMDVEGGVKGNINDAMAAGVEEAVVICPFMTPEYQASRSCKKELNYADTRAVLVVPIMLTKNWEASEWLGLITAGLLWVDFRNAEKDEEVFEMCLRSLEEEIMFNVGHLLAVEEAPREEEEEEEPVPPRPCLKKKPGRGFRHAVSELYIHDSGEQMTPPTTESRNTVELSEAAGDHCYWEQMTPPTTESRNTVELSEAAGDHCYWEEMKGDGCKFYRNVVTNRFLGFDWSRNQVHSEVSPSGSEEWLLLVDQTDQSHKRAVIIKHKRSGSFLAVRDGRFLGLTSYDEDCKWFLE